jgi:hypothetical protein
MHDCYDTDARRQLALDHAKRLADDMRRSRPLRPVATGPGHFVGIRELLQRAAHIGRGKDLEPAVPSYTPK